MTDIIGNPAWSPVRQLETNELAIAGPTGNMNEQAKSLANRTEFLRKNSATKEELSAIGGGGYGFSTLAEFNAKKATLKIDSIVTIGEAGPYQGDNIWNGVELKKSPYDPLQQSKDIIKNEKAEREKLINERLDLFKDKFGFIIADFFQEMFNVYLPLSTKRVITESLETNKIVSQLLPVNDKFTITTNEDIIRYIAHVFQITLIS